MYLDLTKLTTEEREELFNTMRNKVTWVNGTHVRSEEDFWVITEDAQYIAIHSYNNYGDVVNCIAWGDYLWEMRDWEELDVGVFLGVLEV